MLKFSKKPLMIAGGCSLTDENFTSIFHPELDTSWDKWPAIFGKKHGYKVLNVGKSGSGNALICQSVINAVNENPNTKLVLVLWSGWDRFSIYGQRLCPIAVYNKKNKLTQAEENMLLAKNPKYKMQYDLSTIILKNYLDFRAILHDTMFNMWILQDFLKKRNIKYIFAQGVHPISFSFFDSNYVKNTIFKEIDEFLNHMYYDDLDVENFYGWPVFDVVGGHSLDSMIHQNVEKFRISKVDGHPNAKGQEQIAKIYSETYEKVYAEEIIKT